jgi:hypothetical protein
MNAVMLPGRTVFIADTYVNYDPTAEEIAEIALLAADEIRRFGLEPKVALLSHSSFGTSNHPSARKMRYALALLNAMAPDLEVEGEMHGDAAMDEAVRNAAFPKGRGEPARHAHARRGEHRVQPLEVVVGRRGDAGADPARRGEAVPHPDAVRDGAPARQHDRVGGRRREHRCAAAGVAALAVQPGASPGPVEGACYLLPTNANTPPPTAGRVTMSNSPLPAVL